MANERMSVLAQYDATARGQLDAILRRTRQPMSTNVNGSIMDDYTAEVHEKLCEMKRWADHFALKSNEYPDAAVLHFVASLKTS